MGIITTYICDVSGKQGTSEEFVEVTIAITKADYRSSINAKPIIKKLVHIDVATKLHLILPAKDAETTPEPTLESKLTTLLKEYVDTIAYEAVEQAVSNRN